MGGPTLFEWFCKGADGRLFWLEVPGKALYQGKFNVPMGGKTAVILETDPPAFVNSFQVVAADRAITVQVTYDPGSPLTSLSVLAPGPKTLTTVLPRRGATGLACFESHLD